MPTILITGGSGQIGFMLRKRLARPGRILRLLDITPPVSPGLDEQVVVASVTDMAAMTEACAGADAVIHLGGVSGEGPGTGSSRSTSRAPTPCSRQPAGRACPG